MNEIINLIREFGLGVALAVGTFWVFFYLLKWVLKQQEAILNGAADERKSWASLFDKMSKNIEEHTSQARQFHETVNEAHRFQREEHKEMIGALTRINGYKNG